MSPNPAQRVCLWLTGIGLIASFSYPPWLVRVGKRELPELSKKGIDGFGKRDRSAAKICYASLWTQPDKLRQLVGIRKYTPSVADRLREMDYQETIRDYELARARAHPEAAAIMAAREPKVFVVPVTSDYLEFPLLAWSRLVLQAATILVAGALLVVSTGTNQRTTLPTTQPVKDSQYVRLPSPEA